MAVNIGSLTGGTINTVAVAGGVVDPATQTVVTALAQRLAAAMPWLPFDPVGTFALALQQGQYPYPAQTVINPPAWLNDPNRLDVWRQIASKFVPVTQAVLINQLALARQQGQILAANVDFWNTVAKYSGADAVQKVWDDLWAALSQFKAYRDGAKAALDQAGAIVAAAPPGSIPSSLVQNQAVLINQFNSLSNRCAAAIAPLGAAARAAAGLGVVPLVIAGIAAATVAAITATVWAIAHEFAQVQMQANDNAMALIQARDAYARQLLNTGKINVDQFAQLQKDNVEAGRVVSESQGAGQIGKGLKSAGVGVALGLGSVAAIGLGGYLLYRYSKKKSA